MRDIYMLINVKVKLNDKPYKSSLTGPKYIQGGPFGMENRDRGSHAQGVYHTQDT